MFEPFSCDLSDGKSNDIFEFLRTNLSTENLHDAGYVTLFNSSISPGDTHNKDDISTIISGPDGKRWVSGNEDNPYFTIDFHLMRVLLVGYSIESQQGFRFINTWNIFGIQDNGREVLIDSHENTPVCENDNISCLDTSTVPFRCQKPGLFHKFKFVMTAPDSLNENILSLSKIRFFGVLNPFIPHQTFSYQQNDHISTKLTLIFLLM